MAVNDNIIRSIMRTGKKRILNKEQGISNHEVGTRYVLSLRDLLFKSYSLLFIYSRESRKANGLSLRFKILAWKWKWLEYSTKNH